MEIKTPQRAHLMRWELEMKCSICQAVNKVTYSPHAGQETFSCRTCKCENRVLMTFIAMPENTNDMMTMMVKPMQKIGGISRTNVPDKNIKCDE